MTEQQKQTVFTEDEPISPPPTPIEMQNCMICKEMYLTKNMRQVEGKYACRNCVCKHIPMCIICGKFTTYRHVARVLGVCYDCNDLVKDCTLCHRGVYPITKGRAPYCIDCLGTSTCKECKKEEVCHKDDRCRFCRTGTTGSV